MAVYGLDVECPHIFDGTHFAHWRNWMTCNFKFISPQMWWIVDVVFSCAMDKKVATQAQEKCLRLDCQATNIFYSSMKDNIFGEIMDMKSAHEIWVFLNEKYGVISKDVVPNVEAHEDVEHDHNTVVVEDCSTSWSSDGDDDATTRSFDKDDDDATSDVNDHATSCTLDDEDDGYESDASTSSSTTSPHCFMSHGDTKVSIGDVIIDCDGPNFELVCKLSKALRNVLAKTNKLKNENSFLKTTCEQQKHPLYVTTCSHEELKLVHEELCVTHDNLSSSFGSNDQSYDTTNPCDVGKKHVSNSCDDLLFMPCSSHTNACSTSLSFETNLLKENNELKSEVKNLSNKLERCYNSKVTFEHILKTQRNYGDKCGLGFKKKMTKGKRKQEKRKLSRFMCYRCHEVGHLANGCPNKEKLKKIKEEERLKHQLVKQQLKPQPKPRVEKEKKPQAQVKIYHKDGGDMAMMKKKTRRGGRQSRSSKDLSHIKCFECKNDGHFASKCPTKLEKKAQATLKRQGNEKQHMSKEEKAQSKRSCYLCRERGHMAHSCPLGNISRPISIYNHNMLRKDGDGTSMVAIAKYPATHTKASPKYVAPNLRGPKLVCVPSNSG
ncbi:hypothetical protein SORBI_3010G140575 [Sorghum bicolor]|uniref:CCHC-type domain-containing protein n=1 Tax=Sorghum bicolor TaxID=4558 RepID=A0A1W0VSY0_SORBI|nr:hypothetical protein SORBI_3010G140575 [Sorghum bicolor]